MIKVENLWTQGFNTVNHHGATTALTHYGRDIEHSVKSI